MNSDMFIVPYSLHSALHCTQDISFSLFSYCHKFGCGLNRTNEMHGRHQLAFLFYRYVPQILVFVHAIQSSVQHFHLPDKQYMMAFIRNMLLKRFQINSS